MPPLPPLAISAAPLSAEEIATCVRAGIPFTDLAILTVEPGERVGSAIQKVRDALDQSFDIVWQIDPEGRVITVFPSWTHHRVFSANQELVMVEMPYFRCRVDRFFQLLQAA